MRETQGSVDCRTDIVSQKIYVFSYLFISYVIIVNMFSAVVLDSYSQFMKLHEMDLTDENFASFYQVWKQFDQGETHFIECDQLSRLFDKLDPPLQIPKPNRCAIALMNIGICKGTE